MDRPRSVEVPMDTKDLDDSGMPFAGVDITDPSGDKLGDIEGFIMDTLDDGVHRHVVVSARWFIHKRALCSSVT